MKIEIDLDLCAGHGQCEFAAPGVFSLDENAEPSYVAEPGLEQAEDVRTAARVCPTRAIKVLD
jgi:ferredoxin